MYPALTNAALLTNTISHIDTHTHQAFNSYQCALFSFSEVAAAFAPEHQDFKNI